jgi:hypothetical protein
MPDALTAAAALSINIQTMSFNGDLLRVLDRSSL